MDGGKKRMMVMVLCVQFAEKISAQFILKQNDSTTAQTAEQEWTVNDMRLGDLDALEHEFMTKMRYLTKDLVMDAAYIVNKAPTIDAVPVVRCKDCKHRLGIACYCRQWISVGCPWVDPMDFCSYGERKDGGG